MDQISRHLRYAPSPMWLFIALLGIFGIACSPVYTWGYEHAAHPVATASYIRAVLARERGDYEAAIVYYEMALRREDSEKVRAERADVIYRKRAQSEPLERVGKPETR